MAGRRSNTRLAVALAAVCGVMVGASFAAVPFYSWFCRVTGYGGTTSVAAASAPAIVDQVVTIRFDANTAPDMPWEFRPKQQTMSSSSARPASPSTRPTTRPTGRRRTGGLQRRALRDRQLFDKIDCFCFTMQVLQPHERVDMPVSFYVDPAMLDDLEARGTREITLSYTMFRTEAPEASSRPRRGGRLAAAPAAAGTIEQ